VPAVGAALEGRFGTCASLPKKSKPNRESAGLVCFGGAGSAFGGGLDAMGAAETALTGGLASPKRSGCCCLLICDGPADWPAEAF
jgi:hypothetical protein